MERLILSLSLTMVFDWLLGGVLTFLWLRDLDLAAIWPLGYLLWLTSDRTGKTKRTLFLVLSGLIFAVTYLVVDPFSAGILQIGTDINLGPALVLGTGIYVVGFLVFILKGEGWLVSTFWLLFLVIAHSGPEESADRPQYTGPLQSTE